MTISPKENFLKTQISRPILMLDLVLAILYIYAMFFWFPRGNVYLFYLLVASQIYYFYQVVAFIYTLWDTSYMPNADKTFLPALDVFITVAGEPVDIVEETLRSALTMEYPSFRVFILNDGYVAKKDNWEQIEQLAYSLGAGCITRKVAGGAKAGNINNGLRETGGVAHGAPFFVIFDADHAPHRDFLREAIQYMGNSRTAFVQLPQFYKNRDVNFLTEGAWQQQLLFFGPICRGKNRMNSATMCGTNMVIRRSALAEVGGMCDTNIAEDFVTGLFLHERGWKSVFVPKILAQGLAPEDFLSYYKQQFRWARGSLEVLFRFNPLFSRRSRGLTWAQKMQYISSAAYYLSGIFVLINAVIPLIFFYTGLVPFVISTMTLALVFIPYFFVVIYVLQQSTDFSYSFRALSFSMAAFPIHIKAVWAVLTGEKSTFSVTAKRQLSGNFIHLVIPHLAYIVLAIVGIFVAIDRQGLSPSLATNTAWTLFNVAVFLPFIKAALPSRAGKTAEDKGLSSSSASPARL